VAKDLVYANSGAISRETPKMKKQLLVLLIAAIFGVVLFTMRFAGSSASPSTNPVASNNTAAIQWEFVSPNDANMPSLTKAELLAEFQKTILALQKLRSWEAKYDITWGQQALKTKDLPEISRTTHVFLTSNGPRCRYELGQKTGPTIAVWDGNKMMRIWPQQKDVQIENLPQMKPFSSELTLTDFMPSLPVPTGLTVGELPNIFEIINLPDTQLLSSYIRIKGNICYVLEHTETRQSPLFGTHEELEAWKKANPKEAQTWQNPKDGQGFIIFPKAQPGAMLKVEIITRMAFDPKQDFALVRWAQGMKSNYPPPPHQGYSAFPTMEVTYADFRPIAAGINIPFQMDYCRYGIDGQLRHSNRLVMEQFAVDKQYSADVFEYKIPSDYTILDLDRKISYTAGDSKEKTEALVTAAKSRDAFYDNLRQQSAPPLEYALLLNTSAINLADLKGKTIRIHFWSITCAPCMHEMPMLQQQYGSVTQHPDELFISVHPYAEDEDLARVKKTIDKFGLTFPVIIDAKDSMNSSWGKTCKKYGVYILPNEVVIDKEGHFSAIDNCIIGDPGEATRWSNKPLQ
jgi:peroxiredoxin